MLFNSIVSRESTRVRMCSGSVEARWRRDVSGGGGGDDDDDDDVSEMTYCVEWVVKPCSINDDDQWRTGPPGNRNGLG